MRYPTPELEGWDLDDFIKYLDSNITETGKLIQTGRHSHIGEIVKITSDGVNWAGEWATVYNNPRDHHKQASRRKY